MSVAHSILGNFFFLSLSLSLSLFMAAPASGPSTRAIMAGSMDLQVRAYPALPFLAHLLFLTLLSLSPIPPHTSVHG